jgi:sulfate transport system permease protein
MISSLNRSPKIPVNYREVIKNIFRKFSVPWAVTIIFLAVILIIPMAALVAESASLGWANFWQEATAEVAVASYIFTFATALIASLINAVMGTLTAWVLVRYDFWGKKIIDATIDVPFALPTTVAGLVLATVYGEDGWIGQFFTPFGIQITFSPLGVFVAMLFIALPFVVRSLQPVLQEMGAEIEEAAWSLGASDWQTFRLVILPPLLPAISAGVALGFSRAVGSYGTIVIIASNIPFRDLIPPVLVLQKLEQYDYVGATVIGTVLLFISLVLLLIINLLQQWGKRYADN